MELGLALIVGSVAAAAIWGEVSKRRSARKLWASLRKQAPKRPKWKKARRFE
jgi:methylmalonyl-CoA mutase N-terminal domain/subunit